MGSDASRRPPRSGAGRVFRSVRFKIILLLLVPLVSLSTLWAFAANITLGDGLNLRHVNTIQDHLGYPSGALGSALQQERRLSVVFLGSKAPGDRASMESGRLITDRQADLFRRLATDKALQDVANPQAKDWTRQVLQHLDALQTKRRAIDAARSTRSQAFAGYSETISDIIALQASLSTLADPEITKDTKTQVSLARAREVLSQEDALLSGAIAAGAVTFAEHVEFTKLVGTQRTLYAQSFGELRPADRAYYQRITSTQEYHRLVTLEDHFTDHMPSMKKPLAAGGMPASNPLAGMDVNWKTTVSSITTRFRGLELKSTADAAKRARPISDGIILRVVLAGALGLLAVVTSLILSLWVGRSVIHELTGLRRAALDMANERLPSVIRRLRRGEEVDVAAEAPPLSFGTQEIDQVGQAFNAARRTAIQGAVEEATLRRSISEVFLNLARRNQALLHRQLSLLDSMERRVTEPDELDDLFRLDHLATRMRRHAEGLIILSGQAPGRGWRNPVPAIDIARAAAAEVEDYARVTVAAMPRVAAAGPAVADLIHLLAELIENATLYSPPDTTVQVSGQIVAHGFAFEVEDRGLSMEAASLDRANERLADPPEFDLSNSAQLGLFVVGRLAQRHQVQVTLRTSPYGGTTAIVLLPDTIVVRGEDQHEAGPDRLAMTRRGEDALIPIGAIGPPSGPGERTGPMPMVRGDRPPLPRRRSGPGPQTGAQSTYTAGSYDAKPYEGDAAAREADGGSYGSDTGAFDTAGLSGAPSAYDSGSGAGHGATPYPYTADPGDAWSSGQDGHHPGRGGDGTGSSSYDSAGGSYPTGSFSAGSYSGTDSYSGAGSHSDTSRDSASGPRTTGQWSPRETDASDDRPTPVAQRRSFFEPADDVSPAVPPKTSAKPTGNGAKPPLPRRVRQASLAPQLREEAEPVNTVANEERSPEELRTMLSSIQKGWLRGRSDAEQITTHHEEEDI